MNIDLDAIETAEPLVITLDGVEHKLDLLDTLFAIQQKVGDKDVPDDPTELVTIFKDILEFPVTTLQALMVFRALTEEGHGKIDALLKNVLGTLLPSPITSQESASENSDASVE